MSTYFKDLDNVKYPGFENVKTHTFVCGYCGNMIGPNQGMRITTKVTGVNRSPRDVEIGYLYKCPSCNNPSFFHIDSGDVIPGSKPGREIKNLPDDILNLYNECRICHANSCYTAAEMVARKLLMHIAVEKGADENLSFKQYVDYLDTNNYIPPNGKDWVDFIRKTANESNHEIVIKGREESEKVIAFLSTLLIIIYELPQMLTAT